MTNIQNGIKYWTGVLIFFLTFITFSLALISGILSFVFVMILLWNTNIFPDHKLRNTSQNCKIFSKINTRIPEAQDTYEIKYNQSVKTFPENPCTNCESDNYYILSSKWIKNVTLSSYIISALSSIIIASIGILATTSPTNYVYITYFRDHNFTVTIQVILIQKLKLIQNKI